MADNDFQEIFSSFQRVVDDLKKDPAQIIDPESVELAEDLVRKTALRSELQKKFAQSLGESVVYAKIDSALQDEALLKQLDLKKLRDEDRAIVESQLLALRDIVDSNKSLADQLNEQVKAYGEAAGQTKDLSDFQKNIVDLQIQKVKLMVAEHDMLPEFAAQYREELDSRIAINEQLEVARQKTEQTRLINDRMQKVFGFSISSIRQNITETGNLMQTMAGRVTVIAAALGSLFKGLIKDLAEIRTQSGASLQQTLSLGKTAIQGIGASLKQGIVLPAGQAAEITGDLAEHFGDLGHVTADAVAQSARLRVVIGLSAEEATTFYAALAKIPGITPQVEKNVINTADAIARINNIAPAQLFKTMAANTELMARYSAEGQENFAKAAAFATRINVDLSKFDAFADRSLDVTDMIQQFTKLGSLGIDLGDPFKLSQLSESGDIGALQEELHRRLAGRDISVEAIGRVRQRALEQATGFSISDLQRIAKGEQIKGPEEGTPAEQAKTATDQRIDAWTTSIGKFVSSINFATIAMTAFAASALFGGGLKSIAGLGGRLLSGFAGAGAAGAGAAGAGGAVAPAAVATGGSALGALGTGAAVGGTALGGLAAGAGIGTGALELSNKYLGTHFDTFADFARIRSLNQVTPQQQASLESARMHSRMLREQKAGGEVTPVVPQAGVETKLTELITLFKKGGITVVLDGRKVGKLVAAAQPRDSTTGAI